MLQLRSDGRDIDVATKDRDDHRQPVFVGSEHIFVGMQDRYAVPMRTGRRAAVEEAAYRPTVLPQHRKDLTPDTTSAIKNDFGLLIEDQWRR